MGRSLRFLICVRKIKTVDTPKVAVKVQQDDIYEVFSTEPGTSKLSVRAAALELPSPVPSASSSAPTCPFVDAETGAQC